MKKLLTIVLASALVLTFVAPAMAMHFEMNGQLRVRSWYLDNYWPQIISGEQKGDFEFVDQRFRTTMTWGLTENVFLKARADINEGFWGSSIGQATEVTEINPATGVSTRGFNFTNIQAKDQIKFDQMYMQFVWPGAPLTFVIGRQPVNWGTGMAAKADNRDRIKAVIKTGAWAFVLAYDKNVEDFVLELNGAGSDSRNYVLGAVGNIGGWKTGALYVYIKNQSSLLGFVPIGTIPGAFDSFTHLVDIFATGAIGPVNVKADIAFTNGESGLKGQPKTDTEGFGLYLGGFLNAGMANLGLEYAYARGNEAGTDKNEGGFSHDYHGPFNSIILWNGMDYQGYLNLERGVGGDVGFRNAHGVKLSATANPTEKLALIGAVVWGKVDEVALPGRSDELGWEFDAIGVYNIYDNLAWTLGIGYLTAGDYFGDVDNPWGFMNRIEVKF